MLSKLNPNVAVVAVVVVLVAVIGGLLGLYALAPSKPPVTPLFAAIPGGLAFVVTILVASTQRQHGQQLVTIGKNTNGVLTQRITEAVQSAVPVAVATAIASNAPSVFVPAQSPAPDTEQLLPAPADGGPA